MFLAFSKEVCVVGALIRWLFRLLLPSPNATLVEALRRSCSCAAGLVHPTPRTCPYVRTRKT
jgi:hypothetical protein